MEKRSQLNLCKIHWIISKSATSCKLFKESIREIMLIMEDLHTINCEEFFVDIDDEFLKPMVVIFELAECDFNKYLSK